MFQEATEEEYRGQDLPEADVVADNTKVVREEATIDDILGPNSPLRDSSLGDEVVTPRSRQVPLLRRVAEVPGASRPVGVGVGAEVNAPKRFTSIAQVVAFRMKVQAARAATSIIPVAKKIAHAVFGVLYDVTGNPFESRTPVEMLSAIEHLECAGLAGETKVVEVCPQESFQSERIRMTDSHTERGRGTRIRMWSVAATPQMSPLAVSSTASGGIWSSSFADCQFKSKVCDPGLKITFVVHFVEDCTWECDLFGRVVA